MARYTLNADQISIAQQIDIFYNGMEERIFAVVEAKLLEWRRRFPKRSISFMDANGTVMLGVSGGPNMDPYDVKDYWNSRTRHHDIFKDLFDLIRWYNEVSDQCGHLCINDIVIGDPIWPVHWPRDRGHDPLARFD